jgi:hypothetical protein
MRRKQEPAALEESFLDIETQTLDCMDVWQSLREEFPNFPAEFTKHEQAQNEKALDDELQKIDAEASRKDLARLSYAARTERIRPFAIALIAQPLLWSKAGLQAQDFGDFFSAAMRFARDAKQFDEALTNSDIYQALRNILIVNSLQVYLGKPVALTPSGFAYSLLYPYTDNYLDDNYIGGLEKAEFLSTLGAMLRGHDIPAETPRFRHIRELISLIEREYARSKYPGVYESLLAIHESQARSLDEQDQHDLEFEELLEISIAKGGSSVLADAYIAAGIIMQPVSEFAFRYGVALQLMDDLQDLEEDYVNAHRTIFSEPFSRGSLDAATNHLFNFTELVFHSAQSSRGGGEQKAFLEFSLSSCNLLIFQAIARSRRAYSAEYLRNVERHSPLSFSYLSNKKAKFEETYGVMTFQQSLL